MSLSCTVPLPAPFSPTHPNTSAGGKTATNKPNEGLEEILARGGKQT